MADASATSEVSAPAAAVGGAKKAKVAANKKPRAKPAHPKTSEMVANAIKNLKERGGSSLQAIKKYIAANYKVEAEKSAPFIKRYLKSAVLAGELVQTKGKGASGSFKLAGAAGGASEKTVVKRPPAPSKAKDKKTAKKVVSVKSATGRKSAGSATAKKVAASKKAAAAVAPKPKKAPSKAKKAAKSPTKKPKAPRPKKATTPSKAKASPKKRK